MDATNWELCVIGSVVADPAMFEAASELKAADFSTGANRAAWMELMALASRNALGLRSITEALRSSAEFKRAAQDQTPEEYLLEAYLGCVA